MSATVIIDLLVKAGCDDAFRHWQDDVSAAAATFPGFQGTQVTSPSTRDPDWSIVYRFDTVDQLDDWLDSPIRRELIDLGASLFEAPPRQHVMVGGNEGDVVTIVITHTVDPADEDAFLAWEARITRAQQRFPGFRGSERFRPVPGVQDQWTILYRFDTDEDAQAWLDSPVRAALLREGEHFRGFGLERVHSAFGSWFAFGDGAAGPPKWKTASSILAGLYPTVVLLSVVIAELFPLLRPWQTILISNTCSLIVLTWVVMPLVTRVLRFWLAPAPHACQPRTDLLGLALVIGIVAAIATTVWLVTREIWVLP